MSFQIRLETRAGRRVLLPNDVSVEVQRYRWGTFGGPLSAEVTLYGNAAALWRSLGWLGYHIVIYNSKGTPVWWGFVDEVAVSAGRVAMGASLAAVANRIKAVYSYETPNGTITDETDWVTDDESIDRFGTRERILSLNDTPEDLADARVAAELERYGRPKGVPTLDGSGDESTSLLCAGFFSTFGHFYYENLRGREIFDTLGSVGNALGWVMGPKTGIVFSRKHNRIGDAACGFTGLPEGQTFRVTGSDGNNRSFVVEEEAQVTAPVSIAFPDVQFVQEDDVEDKTYDPQFDQFTAGEPVYIVGTDGGGPNNDGYWMVKDVIASNYMTLYGGEIGTDRDVVNQNPTAPTITQGNSVKCTATVTGETQGDDTVTITADGLKIGQRFTLTENTDAWPVSEIWINLRRVGNPSDNVVVSLYTDVSALPGTLIESSTAVVGSDIHAVSTWVKFSFSGANNLSYGSYYWIVVERSGSSTNNDFYVATLNASDLYGGGYLRLWDGSTWQSRGAGDASLNFQIWLLEPNSAQIAAIADANDWISGVDLLVNGTIDSRVYQDGSLLAGDLLDDLVPMDGTRWLVNVDINRRLKLYAAPASTTVAGYVTPDGQIRPPAGRDWEEGVLPVGVWLAFDELPGYNDSFVGVEAQFVEACEYDVRSGQIAPEFGDRYNWTGIQHR